MCFRKAVACCLGSGLGKVEPSRTSVAQHPSTPPTTAQLTLMHFHIFKYNHNYMLTGIKEYLTGLDMSV